MLDKEVRYLPVAELRLDQSEEKAPRVEGYAAVFNTLSGVLRSKTGSFREVIRPGAFTRVLGEKPDVRLLINHEGLPLARTKSGTMQMAEDQKGLRFSAALDTSDPDVQRLLPK